MKAFKCLCLCVCDARGNKTSLLLCLRILGYKSLAFTVQTSCLTHLLMKKLKPEKKGSYHNNRPSEWKRKPTICMGEAEVLCTTRHCFFKGMGGVSLPGGGLQNEGRFPISWQVYKYLHTSRRHWRLDSSLSFQQVATSRVYLKEFFPLKHLD